MDVNIKIKNQISSEIVDNINSSTYAHLISLIKTKHTHNATGNNFSRTDSSPGWEEDLGTAGCGSAGCERHHFWGRSH